MRNSKIPVRGRMLRTIALVAVLGVLVSACAGASTNAVAPKDGLMQLGPFTFVLPQAPNEARPDGQPVIEAATAIDSAGKAPLAVPDAKALFEAAPAVAPLSIESTTRALTDVEFEAEKYAHGGSCPLGGY